MKALALKENQSAGARGKPKKAGKFPKTGQVDVANQIDNNMLFGVCITSSCWDCRWTIKK